MKLYSRIKVGVAIVGAILLVGTAGFHWIEGWPWFDGLYITLTTLTTIGYQELHPLSPAGRLFNTFLIIVGVSSLFFLIGAFTQAMIEFELGTFFGRRRLERQISKLEGHYIICGAGRVGRSAAREFRARPVPFVIIERDENKVRWAAEEEMLVLIGDATREETLRAALRKVDGQMHFNPSATSRIEGGDHLIAMGQPNDLKQLEAMAR